MPFMSERDERIHNSDAAQGPERITDPKTGLERLRDAMKHILKVPKSVVAEDGDGGKTKGAE